MGFERKKPLLQALFLLIISMQAFGTSPITMPEGPGPWQAPAFKPARIYYVSPKGSNKKNGSIESPWKTIQYALEKGGPGSLIFVRGGTYKEKITFPHSGTSSAWITLQTYPGEEVILSGVGLSAADGDQALVSFYDVRYLQLIGFHITGYSNSKKNISPIAITIAEGSDYINLINCTISAIATRYDPGGNFISGADAHGIAVFGNSGKNPVSHIAVVDCEIRDCILGSSEALVLNGNVETFWLLNNRIHDNNNIGIDIIGYEGTAPSNDRARKGIIAGNRVYNISTQGNPAYRKGPGLYSLSAGGIYVDGGTNVIIEGNEIFDNDFGVELASENRKKATDFILLRNNFIYHNRSAGLAMGGYDEKRGYTENCLIIGNSFYKNDTMERGAGEILLQFEVKNNLFKNNIIYAGPGNNCLMNYFDTSRENEFNSNLWYSAGGAENSTWLYAKSRITGFSEWRKFTGGNRSFFANPRFKGENPVDLHIQTDSPAVDAGEPIEYAGAEDFDGDPRSRETPDIGADELR